jgi:hypothetical protein
MVTLAIGKNIDSNSNDSVQISKVHETEDESKLQCCCCGWCLSCKSGEKSLLKTDDPIAAITDTENVDSRIQCCCCGYCISCKNADSFLHRIGAIRI